MHSAKARCLTDELESTQEVRRLGGGRELERYDHAECLHLLPCDRMVRVIWKAGIIDGFDCGVRHKKFREALRRCALPLSFLCVAPSATLQANHIVASEASNTHSHHLVAV